MAYNYVRFDNPFEFGQTYQLTSADQSGYGSGLSQFDPVKILNGLIYSFWESPSVSPEFPWLSHGGVFWECPALLLGFAAVLDRDAGRRIRENRLAGFLAAAAAAVLIIIVVQTAWSPWLLRRYGEDYIWLLAAMAFIAAGFRCTGAADKTRIGGLICWLAFSSFLISCLLILIPENYSFTTEETKILWRIAYVLRLGNPAG